MKNFVITILVLIIALGLGYFFLYGKKQVSSPTYQNETVNDSSQNTSNSIQEVTNEITCSDTDGGSDIYAKGVVSFSEPFTLNEGSIAHILSSDFSEIPILGKMEKLALGVVRSFTEPDQVF